MTLNAAGRLEQGRKALERANAGGPFEPHELRKTLVESALTHAQASFEVGRLLKERGNEDEALVFLRAAHLLAPSRGKYALLLAQALEKSGSSIAEGLEVCTAAVKGLPHAANAHYHLANALQRAGRFEEALGGYAAALRLNPRSPMYYYQKGVANCRLNRWHDAIAALRTAQELDPELAYAIHQEGLCWFNLGEFRKAIEAQERAYSLRPVEHFRVKRDEAQAALDAGAIVEATVAMDLGSGGSRAGPSD